MGEQAAKSTSLARFAAPTWEALPESVRQALASRGMDAEWWASRDGVVRQTALNLFAKLVLHDLWRFVAREDDSGPGSFHFRATDVDALQKALAEDKDFTRPSGRGEGWQSREQKARGTLHFKHFDGWPTDRLQAHIDAVGLGLTCGQWATLVLPLVQLVRHWLTYDSYKDVAGLRALLLEQGVSPEVLFGEEGSS